MLDSKGNAKLTDFGLSKLWLHKNVGKTFTFCGTPEYLAPEIILKEGHNNSADWWSLGILIYEMLAGVPPFSSPNLKILLKKIVQEKPKMRRHFSPEAKDLLSLLLMHEPALRLGSSERDSLDIKKHSFYKSIDWSKLMNQEITPPIIPEIKNIDDVNNFDQIYTDVQITNSSFLCNNPNQNKLENFTYVKDESCAMDEINKNDIELSDSLLKSEENE